ncbi:uncharacterized protein [Venturia canescens]|uniref:uncharacterized protein n=1 Tax=Venturia canescens TaxID=32260 RepID=UPI001C9CFAFC|nr:uncharacterized protein LOC122411483 [Venturia canescens]
MALSRIRCSKDLPAVLTRLNRHPVNGIILQLHPIGPELDIEKCIKSSAKARIHVSGVRRYPEAPKLPLPSNVSEIFGNETGRFTPERSRDIAAPVLFYATGQLGSRDVRVTRNFIENSSHWGSARASCGDNHVDSYDCFGAVSLNSSMQSNVPLPYCSNGKASHFNMPGGQWAKDSKYIAEDMQKSHYTSIKARELRKKKQPNGCLINAAFGILMPKNVSYVEFSTDTKSTTTDSANIEPRVDDNKNSGKPVALTNAEKLKKAVKDYGSTVIVFHIGISLISLGACYLAVSSGIDFGSLVKMISNGGSERLESAMANSSTFLIAYAVHKIFAPIRISITLGATPFLVRYLRSVGVLKIPKM